MISSIFGRDLESYSQKSKVSMNQATIGYGSLPESKIYDDIERNINDDKNSKTTLFSRTYALGICAFALIIFSVAVRTYPSTAVTNLKTNVKSTLTNLSELVVTVSNEYGQVTQTKYPYKFLSDSLFAETYKNNIFSVSGALDSCSYEYHITGVTDPSYTAYSVIENNSFYFQPTTPGQYTLLINEYCDEGLSREFSKSIWSKYVRRELSALTDEDREIFLDAFHTLWEVNTLDGQQKYGANYKDINYFAVIHNDAGASGACDEFHGKSGFLFNHAMLGAYLEQSLRLVNPKTSLHNMEYMKYCSFGKSLAHDENQLDGGSWIEMMTSKYFGSNDPYSGRIVDGRWANSQIPRVTKDFLVNSGVDPSKLFFPAESDPWFKTTSDYHLMSPYGLLRSPWNYNPSKYLTRYNNVNRIADASKVDSRYMSYFHGVGCSDYDNFVNHTKGNSLSLFLQKIEDSIHGNMHFTVAGAGGDLAYAKTEAMRQSYGFDDGDVFVLTRIAQEMFKFYITCSSLPTKKKTVSCPTLPFTCTKSLWDSKTETLLSTSVPGDSHGPQCAVNPAFIKDDESSKNLLDLMFSEWTENDSEYAVKQKFLDMDFSTRASALTDFFSRYQYDGDMASSAAALDPLFWVLHGSMERLYQKFEFNSYFSDYNYGDELSTCSGHSSTGTKAWLDGFSFSDPAVVASTITNQEFVTALNPNSDFYRDNVNYIFDHSDWTVICSGDAIQLFDY